MAGEEGEGGNKGILITLIVILVMVIIYALMASPAERERLLGPITYERYLIQTTPGELTPIPATTYKLSHSLGTIEPNFAPTSIVEALAGQMTLKRSLIQNQDAKFTILLNKTDSLLQGWNLQFQLLMATKN